MLPESRSLESGLARRLEEEQDGSLRFGEREPLLVVPKIGIHLGSAPERSPRWATGFEEWIDVEAGEDGRRESLVRPMARNGVRPRRPLYGA